MNKEELKVKKTIIEILDILTNNFKYSFGKKISFEDIFEMMKDLYSLFQNFEENVQECGELVIKRYIPLLDLLVQVDTNPNHYQEYAKQLK